jgi:hypothetical protein
LAAAQPRLAKSDASARHRDVLHDLVLSVTARTMNRLSVRLDDGRAHDWQRSFRCATKLELEQTLTSLLQLGSRSLGFSALASGTRLFGHLAGPPE